MSAGALQEGNDRDSGVVEEICGYLTEAPRRSFFLFAGAGSGKTRTLVEVLRRLTGVVEHAAGGEFAQALRLFGRSIRVITFTKNAVAVINGRLGNNDLVTISTIHAFCWELIQGFNDDIRDALIALTTKKLEDDRLESAAKARGASATDQARHAEMATEIDAYGTVSVFRYHPDRNTFGPGAIQHRQVLDATSWLLMHRPTLQTILRDRHPIVLIDESQDTMKSMLDSLMVVAQLRGGLTLGLLGDHRQHIYTDGHADLPGLVPRDWAKPELQMNHRSQERIVTLINKVWEANLQGRTQQPTGVKQHHRTEKTGGVVRIFVGTASQAPEEKVIRERWCAGQMVAPVANDAWATGGYQLLALEHKLVATRGSFLNVYEAMHLIDPSAAAPAGNGENKGPSAVQFLLIELAQLASCSQSDGAIDEYAATEILRRSGAMERLPEDTVTRRTRSAEVLKSIIAGVVAARRENATVRDVLAPILAINLFEVDARLTDAFAENSLPPPPPVPRSKEKETAEARMRRGWCKLFASPWTELGRYRLYLEGESELATHQVVKGSEFAHVMVVMDDSEAGGFLIAYDKLFGAKKLSATDMFNVNAGKETAIDRSLRLLYMTASRARESLALVLWAEDPVGALATIQRSDWFSAEEIALIP